jgi:DNA-binding TFAR19-related protein (PDSD5 family)
VDSLEELQINHQLECSVHQQTNQLQVDLDSEAQQILLKRLEEEEHLVVVVLAKHKLSQQLVERLVISERQLNKHHLDLHRSEDNNKVDGHHTRYVKYFLLTF